MVNDVEIRYEIEKKVKGSSRIVEIINFIKVYIQNNEIYFKSIPFFENGTFVVIIIGEEKDHKKFQDALFKVLPELNGRITKIIYQ